MRQLLGELRELLVNVAAARDELAVVPVHDRQGTEAVVLQLEEAIGMIEGSRQAKQRHRSGLRVACQA